MADLNSNEAAQSVRIVGSDSSGLETTPVASTIDGRLKTDSIITNSLGNEVSVKNSAPLTSDYGLVVRQVALELPTFSASSFDTLVGNNKSMLALQNTGTSVVRIREVWIINDRTTATTGVAGVFQINRFTSYTGGTNIVPSSYDSADTLPVGVSMSTGATIAGETAILREGRWSTDEWGPGTLDTESLDHAIQNITPFFSQASNCKGLTVRQNEGVHIKFATNSVNGAFTIRLIFTTE